MKVLVTGGAGFIGSHIVDTLIQNNYQVVVIDNFSTGLRENLNPAAAFIEMDICSKEILSLFQAENFDFVIHQAAQTMVPKSIEVPDYDCEINILGTVNILEACRKTGVKRVVFASTAAVYGNVSVIPVPETALAQPTSFYGLSKLTVENYLSLYWKTFGLEYVILRYANVYGERQGDAGEGGVISIFARKACQREAIAIFGDGEQTRDFVYVGDVALANMKAIQTGQPNQIFNVSTETETTVNALVELMGIVSGQPLQKTYQPIREGDIYRSTLSNVAARSALDWSAAMPLLDGLMRTYRSLENKF